MNALQVASSLARVMKSRTAISEAAHELRQTADAITEARFHPEDDNPLDAAAEIKAGAAAAADELGPVLGLLDRLGGLTADPTGEIVLDETAREELEKAAASMRRRKVSD